MINPARIASLFLKGQSSARHAYKKNTVGMEFDAFGRNLWWRLLRSGQLSAARKAVWLLLNPVSLTRYFEFAFVLQCLPDHPGGWLDVSSPRLFSLFGADKKLATSIKMINPDKRDISETAALARQLRLHNIDFSGDALGDVVSSGQVFDCVLSISVIEHIAGAYDDSAAMKMMYALLKPGGRLIITTTTDRTFYEEYRKEDTYEIDAAKSGNEYFFQRVYDENALSTRLFDPIGQRPVVTRWFGEKIPGRFTSYEKQWIAEGLACTVDDPREIADHYQEFASWKEMPGEGVCAFMIQKPLQDSSRD